MVTFGNNILKTCIKKCHWSLNSNRYKINYEYFNNHQEQSGPTWSPNYNKTLEDNIKKIIPGKACGPDSIRTEMLKNSTPELQPALIFQSGDKLDPNNYRGIWVSSNMGKVFCRIINPRIDNKWTDFFTQGVRPGYNNIQRSSMSSLMS